MSLVSYLVYGLLNLHEFLKIQMSVTFHFYYDHIPVSCALPAPPLNGALLNTNSQNTNLIEGSVIAFQCDPGFSLVGAATATCNNSGLWDPDPALLECISRSCTYMHMSILYCSN